MKNIDFRRVSTILGNLYCGPDKNSNTIKLWQKSFKGVLNAQEAKRLFEAFAGDANYLIARTTRMMVWNKSANPDNWTATWCENFFKKHGIQSVFGMTCGPDGKALHPRKRSDKSRKSGSKKDLSAFSDEDLIAELQRRDDERKAAEEFARKKALIEEFLSTYDLAVDDLLEIAQVI